MWASQVALNSVQSLNSVWLFATPWSAACQASLSITNSRSSNSCPLSEWCHHPSHPLSPPSPAFNFPSIRVFSNELVLRIKQPEYWNIIFSIASLKECSGLISFRIDWFNLLKSKGLFFFFFAKKSTFYLSIILNILLRICHKSYGNFF